MELPMERKIEVKRVYAKMPVGEQPSDFSYWQTQSYQARIAALEEIRKEFHSWRYDAQPRLQRIYSILNDNDVRYLVVGGYAVALHGYPRYTKDIAIWVESSQDNAVKLLKALEEFGFGS